jgi:hypothetical protein
LDYFIFGFYLFHFILYFCLFYKASFCLATEYIATMPETRQRKKDRNDGLSSTLMDSPASAELGEQAADERELQGNRLYSSSFKPF